ncbi:MAG: GGDEF domain-containing protein, partial [Butyrivibrio sp.]|nr:GGDEF domain-containing protein [Butyrivibrio sp.]
MNLIRRISSFFFKDVENNNETKQAAVLVRILSFVMGIYFVFQVIVFWITGDLLLDALSMVCLAGYAHSFIGTYKERTREVRYFIIALTLLWIVIYVYLLGWDFGVQHFLFVLLIFILLTSYFGTAKKVMVTAVLCAIRLSLYLYTLFYLPVKIIVSDNGIFFQSVNTIVIFTAVAWMIIFVSGHSLVMEKKLIDYNEKIRRLAAIDPLTGLLNRRGFIEKLIQIAPEGKRWDTEYVNIAIGDIDFFKQVNDTYGHEAG